MKLKHSRHLLPLALGVLMMTVSACKKPEETTPPDEGETAGDTGDTETPAEPEETGPPQEPDPAAIAEARAHYLLGQYEEANGKLEPILPDLKEREQYRASGLTAGWLALSLAHDVAENAKEPADYAISMAEKTGDKEVIQVAKAAHGAYLIGVMEFPQALADLEEAISADPSGANAPLALVLAGEAKMNMAFGPEDKIVNPGEFDAAAGYLEKAAGLVTGGEPADKALLAKINESQAAVLRYKNDTKGSCAKADEALKLYGEAGVSDFVMEGVNQLKKAAGCK